MIISRILASTTAFAASLSLMLLSGCNGGGQQLSPEDFSDPTRAGADAEHTAVAAESHARATRRNAERRADTEHEQTEAAPATETADATADADGLFVDAMVGQINGRPVYASTIFRAIGEDVLEQIGRNQTRTGFRREIERLIVTEMRSRVIDSLTLAEAQNTLSERQRHQLRAFMEQERERILAQHLGSAALAEQALKQELGHGLEQELKSRRERVLIEQYWQSKIMPQVVVTRRDVERHYRDNFAEYNQPPTLHVRVILLREPARVDAVEAALAEGESFADVASRYSAFRASQGGKLPEVAGFIDEFDALPWPELNEAIAQLAEGERTERIELEDGQSAWAMLEELEGGRSSSLKEVFLEIERGLRAARADRLQRRAMADMLENGNYTPLEQMSQALIEIAMSRYARPE